MDPTTDDVEMQNPVSESEDEAQAASKPPPPLSTVDQQRLSLYILTQRDRPIPSFESMKKFLESPDDIDARVEELNEQYAEDLERLYTALAEEYMDEAEDRYYSFDEKVQPIDDIQALYSDLRSENSNEPVWDSAIHYTSSTYQKRMNSEDIVWHLKNREKKAAEMDFPQSIEEYRLKPKETQQRAARFLVLETDENREKMMSEFGWTWRLVTPLKDEFQTNQDFQEEIRATIVELNVGDPRKR
ncbi:hypothetical protein B0H19DRAFT_1132590 [Mycena capillaripes]|nr:hypothetical protein B0H19DRAFT_1132590 [Mycena capillaripes]